MPVQLLHGSYKWVSRNIVNSSVVLLGSVTTTPWSPNLPQMLAILPLPLLGFLIQWFCTMVLQEVAIVVRVEGRITKARVVVRKDLGRRQRDTILFPCRAPRARVAMGVGSASRRNFRS